MENQDYDIIRDINHEILVMMLKQSFRSTFPPRQAEEYCRQLDDAHQFAKWLNEISKRNSRGITKSL
jgi:hypothetical protein